MVAGWFWVGSSCVKKVYVGKARVGFGLIQSDC